MFTIITDLSNEQKEAIARLAAKRYSAALSFGFKRASEYSLRWEMTTSLNSTALRHEMFGFAVGICDLLREQGIN